MAASHYGVSTIIRGCVFSGLGGFSQRGGGTGCMGPDGCGTAFIPPPFSAHRDVQKNKRASAGPFEAGGGRMGDSNRVCGLGKARATTPHFPYS